MVLGGTIAELQARMPLREVHVWLAYRNKYGPMSDVRRFDRPAALIASLISRAHGGKAELRDFMPFGIDQDAVSMDEIIAAFGEVKIGKRR